MPEPAEQKSAKEDEEEAEIERMGKPFSPKTIIEAIVMFPLAGALDLIGIILIFFGLDDFGITDIIGTIFIGGWMFFRSGTFRVTRRAKTRIGRMAKWAKRLKWLRPLLIILEFIPYVGIIPSWLVLVYLELKYG